MVRWRRFALSALCAIAALSARPVMAQAQSAGQPGAFVPSPAPADQTPAQPVWIGPGPKLRRVAFAVSQVRDACAGLADSPAAAGPSRPPAASGLDLPADIQLCRYALNPNTTRMAFWLQGSLFGAMAGGIGAVTFVALRWLIGAVLGAAGRGFRRRSGGRASESSVRGR